MQISCQLCKTKNYSVIFTKLIKKNINIEIVKCDSCDFIFNNTIIEDERLKKFIFYDYYKSKNVGHTIDKRFIKHFKKRAKNHINLIAKFYGPRFNGSVLDVGCGAGIFLNEMRKKGWDVSGIEPSNECYEYATKNYNLKIYRMLFEEFDKSEKFDLIYFSHIFDDLNDIVDVINKTKEYLTNNGKIFIEVPNYIRDKKFKLVKDGDLIENKYYFSRSSIKNLLEKNGLIIEKLISYEPIYLNTIVQYLVSPMGLLKRIFFFSNYKSHIRLIASNV
jgi:2-polyprenyl-3-methyl-5-hydroxy-6-metoxy-1,4-benzoquinol methylase